MSRPAGAIHNSAAEFQGRFRPLGLICSGLWILFFSCTVVAQPITVTPSLAFENSALLAIRRNPGLINRFPSDGFGRSYNQTFWLGSDFAVPKPFWEFDAILRLRLGASKGLFTSRPYVDTSGPAPTVNEFQVASRQNLIQLDILLAYTPLNNLVLVAGPWASFRLFSSTVETEYILEPDSALFSPTNTRERIIDAGNILESYPLRIGMVAGVGYDIRIASFLSVRPLVAGRCDLEGLWKGLGKRAFSLDIGAAFDIGSIDNTAAVAPTIVIDTMAILTRQSNITAAVDIFNTEAVGAERDRTPVLTQRTIHRQYLPLSTFIFFDPDSENLPARYRQSASNMGKGQSQEAQNDPAILYQTLLSTLANRLQETPAGHITLRGIVSPGESSATAARRAEIVASYLENTFGVRRSQITVEAGGSKGCGSKFAGKSNVVKIALSPSALLSPSLAQWVVQDYIVPRIGVNKKISSTLGVKEWGLAIWQGKQQVASTSANDNIGGEFDAVFSRSNFVVDSSAIPLIAELTVYDHVGGKAQARDELHFQIQESEAANDREVRTYFFLEPDAECPEMIAINKALISNIVSTTQSDARIIITSKGKDTDKWNALKVAEQISSTLNQHSVLPKELRVVHSASSDNGQKGEHIPETTMYSQAVSVRVEQKLDRNR